jgi:hypothetical protein
VRELVGKGTLLHWLDLQNSSGSLGGELFVVMRHSTGGASDAGVCKCAWLCAVMRCSHMPCAAAAPPAATAPPAAALPPAAARGRARPPGAPPPNQHHATSCPLLTHAGVPHRPLSPLVRAHSPAADKAAVQELPLAPSLLPPKVTCAALHRGPGTPALRLQCRLAAATTCRPQHSALVQASKQYAAPALQQPTTPAGSIC